MIIIIKSDLTIIEINVINEVPIYLKNKKKIQKKNIYKKQIQKKKLKKKQFNLC